MSANAEHDRNENGSGNELDLTAYALEQLDDAERAEIERQLADANGDGQRVIDQTRQLAAKVRETLVASNPAASEALRKTILHRLSAEQDAADEQPVDDAAKVTPAAKEQSFWRRYAVELVAGSLVALLLVALLLPAGQYARSSARRMAAANNLWQVGKHTQSYETARGDVTHSRDSDAYRYQQPPSDDEQRRQERFLAGLHTVEESLAPIPDEGPIAYPSHDPSNPATGDHEASLKFYKPSNGTSGLKGSAGSTTFGVDQGWAWGEGGRTDGAMKARYEGESAHGNKPNVNYDTYQRLGGRADGLPINGEYGGAEVPSADPRAFGGMRGAMGMDVGGDMLGGMMPGTGPGTEQYAPIVENDFIRVQGIDALSTFSIDVDTASYANVRRFLTNGQLPPPNAVRLEELVNYFSYDYPQPKAGEPFSVNMEVAECPWQTKHLLLRVGLKGREIHHKERPVSNLVFLLDVSGSMADQNKLPLLKQVLSMMVRELREDDRVSIVTYAGEAGLRLPPTTGDQQAKILQAIDSLSSGGSTNGSAGIDLAYEQARGYFRKEGTNRVILATDGDLNVGITDDESLVQLIKQKATGGTFLTVLGFGEGNLKDAKMERLADNGNGIYAYIDSVREGRKVLIEQMSGSLVTIAKDVKIQIEFNPQEVQSYRLLGYENRMLTAPEFSDDKRDAGEIGAGHSVTALYELVPAGQAQNDAPASVETPALRYQESGVRGQESGVRGQESGVRGQESGVRGESKLTDAAASGELLTLKLRYKEPDGVASKLSEHPLRDRGGKFAAASKDFQFASAVASFGMVLRNSQHRGGSNLAATAEIAAAALGEDKGGYRAEFVDLVRKAQQLRP